MVCLNALMAGGRLPSHTTTEPFNSIMTIKKVVLPFLLKCADMKIICLFVCQSGASSLVNSFQADLFCRPPTGGQSGKWELTNRDQWDGRRKSLDRGRNGWTRELVPTHPAINVSSLIFGSRRMWLH